MLHSVSLSFFHAPQCSLAVVMTIHDYMHVLHFLFSYIITFTLLMLTTFFFHPISHPISVSSFLCIYVSYYSIACIVCVSCHASDGSVCVIGSWYSGFSWGHGG